MWQSISKAILTYRIPILIIIAVLTVGMWVMRGTEFAQDYGKVIPPSDSSFIEYTEFKKVFGEDGNVMVLGVEGDLFEKFFFNGMYRMVEGIRAVEGVENVISITHLSNIGLDTANQSFAIERILTGEIESEAQMDSVASLIRGLPFYADLILNEEKQTTLIAISIPPSVLNSKEKVRVMQDILAHTDEFEQTFEADLKFAGLPFLRIYTFLQIPKELALFLALAMLVTAIALFFFFRSLQTVLLPLGVVAVTIIWSLGILGICGYQINLVIGLTPALITVIGIPNCVYLITKYHIEYKRTQDQMLALQLVIQKIGTVTVMTNATTAIGLGVLAFTDIELLQEFGVLAGLSVMAAFFISILLLPICFSFLPPPKARHLKHLERKSMNSVIEGLDYIVHHHRKWVYVGAFSLIVLSVIGLMQLKPVAYVMDDIPESGDLKQDLSFIEDRFNGVMPFEISIDTKKPRGAVKLRTLNKINELQDSLKQYPEIASTVSMANVMKFVRQGFVSGKAEDYLLPSRNEYRFMQDYLSRSQDENNLGKVIVDSSLQITRVSGNIRDIGSIEMKRLLGEIQADVDSIFDPEKYEVILTGTTKIHVRSNEYLIRNLIYSLALAFVIIGFLMGILFRSPRMVFVSLTPNILPLMLIAGIMGFFHIPLKPSTALVFSIAFGIAVDDSIHFLARYRQALQQGFDNSQAVSQSFKDTGLSMIYTSLILFLGFIIFTLSTFGGTQALGSLTSFTLLSAMLSNLVLLPSLLLSFGRK